MAVVLLAMVPAAGSGGTVAPGLLARAAAEGAVRVIVGLRLPAGATADVAAIAGVRAAVLRAIAGTRHRVVRTYDTIPFVALEASVETLQALAAAPEVSSVEEDALARPN